MDLFASHPQQVHFSLCGAAYLAGHHTRGSACCPHPKSFWLFHDPKGGPWGRGTSHRGPPSGTSGPSLGAAHSALAGCSGDLAAPP